MTVTVCPFKHTFLQGDKQRFLQLEKGEIDVLVVSLLISLTVYNLLLSKIK